MKPAIKALFFAELFVTVVAWGGLGTNEQPRSAQNGTIRAVIARWVATMSALGHYQRKCHMVCKKVVCKRLRIRQRGVALTG
ncbi:hypothetical protein OMP38_18030 [Cohnella ginsengisoli]|uniref:Uncharacterized protein n=1 Tax=Cohnella ginsengisoli TaxID=425004 RepID=A0A9X4QNG7_9BACL|nr:hypothetical protein [Cohnella ginsengisoli]MDG0792561.1 hypothetical protein [Cohnella ginsengisoli]